MLVANFIRLRAEGFRPNRDLILLFTADEEYSGGNLAWLLEEHRPLIDAAFALNTDAGPGGPAARRAARGLRHADGGEDLRELRAGGIQPRRPQLPARPDNAIYKLARGPWPGSSSTGFPAT